MTPDNHPGATHPATTHPGATHPTSINPVTINPVTIHPVSGLPEIDEGTDLAAALLGAIARPPIGGLAPGDVLVVSSKVLSKAAGLRASPAHDKAALVLEQSHRVVAERATPGGTTRVVEALAGPVMAAAGIDASNTGARESYLLLPADPDAAAARLLADLRRLGAPVRLGLLVSDTAGRPWRVGQTDFALGAAGLAVLDDRRGQVDADGRPIAVTARAVADELAAAADLVKGKAWQVPAAVLRDLPAEVTDPSPGAPDPCDPPRVNPVPGARSLVRTGPGDWFALGHVEAVRAALGVAPGSPESEAVGLVPVHDEPAEARLTRVARLATHAVPGATWALVEAAPPTDSPAEPTARQSAIQVSADTPLDLGRLLARLEVAAWADHLHALAEVAPDQHSARVALHPVPTTHSAQGSRVRP